MGGGDNTPKLIVVISGGGDYDLNIFSNLKKMNMYYFYFLIIQVRYEHPGESPGTTLAVPTTECPCRPFLGIYVKIYLYKVSV